MKTIRKKFIMTISITILLSLSQSYAQENWGDVQSANDALQSLNAVDGYRNTHGNTYTTGNSAANLIVDYVNNTVSVTCDNGGGSSTTTLTPAEIAATVAGAQAGGYDIIVLAPPVPVITSSSSSQSCSYISSYSPAWSDCSINSNWNTNGNITCSQTNSWQANTSSASWSCTTTYVDGTPSGTSCNGSCPSSVSKPAVQTDTKTITMSLSNPTTTTNNAFANNIDSNNIKVNIFRTTNQNKPIIGLVGTSYGNISDIKDTSGLKANRIDNSGVNALNFSSVSDNNIQGSGNSFYFDITGVKSYAPISTNNGTISFKVNGITMNLSNIDYKFDKVFTSSFNTTNLKIGTTQKVELGVTKQNSSNSSISTYNVSNINSSILVNPSDKFVIENKGSEYNINSNPSIDLRINYKGGVNISSEIAPYLSVNPIITYTINGVSTKYYISNTKDSSTNNKIASSTAKFDSIKVAGTLQSEGKANLTGQKTNFSDLSKSTQRAEIRKNATILTKNMISGTIVNGVKYIIGDISISGNNLGFETIVVKDGNLTISGDLNTDGKKLGIIILKDGYNVDNGYNGKGNIYIDKSVKYINATLYADGGVISSNGNNPYTSDSDSRTNSLQTQLVIKGSVFTRNTIGGAILGTSGKYKLPGGQETTDFDKAMIYDMNYLRRGNNSADSTKNGGNTNNVVIIYNSSIQNNPPKGFTSN